MVLLVKLQKGRIWQELGYLKGSVIEPYRYHVVFLWNGVVGDWLSVGTWFGACCAPGARMQHVV